MFKFNNNHIFTGYLKQLLASFHLPKCKVYTKELETQELNYQKLKATLEPRLEALHEQQSSLENSLKEITALLKNPDLTSDYKTTLQNIKLEYSKEYTAVTKELQELQNCIPKIIPTVYHSEYLRYPGTIPDNLQIPLAYPDKMRYMPYIKDGQLQVYADSQWHDCHTSFTKWGHTALHKDTKLPYTRMQYSYGQRILNYTKNLQIQNTIYDSYTHEYLGDYLRFHRDFANINLMPLYNCFSNRACPHLNLNFIVGNNYEVKFKTDQSFETALYKYYMVPVKFFKDYTIAIDSEASIEVCCCIYDEYQDSDKDFEEIPKLTYQCFSDLQFKKPVLYTKLQNLNGLLVDPASSKNDLCQQEDSLKLILKIPAANNSSIVILEGDYTTYNDVTHTKVTQGLVTAQARDALLGLVGETDTEKEALRQQKAFSVLESLEVEKANAPITKQTNKTVINYDFDNLGACDILADKLITPLQLLRANTGESYPFADRLVEYLVGNAITVNEEIQDNVVRAKTVISTQCEPAIHTIVAEDGIWEPILQCLIYDYINEKHNTHDINHDILGFVDKDVEKWYTAKNRDEAETIANIDIYKDWGGKS